MPATNAPKAEQPEQPKPKRATRKAAAKGAEKE